MKQLIWLFVLMFTLSIGSACSQAQAEAQQPTPVAPPAEPMTVEEWVQAIEEMGYEVHIYEEGESLFSLAQMAQPAGGQGCTDEYCLYLGLVVKSVPPAPAPTAVPPTATPGAPMPTSCPTRPGGGLPDAPVTYEEHISGIFVTGLYQPAEMWGSDILIWQNGVWNTWAIIRSYEQTYWVPRVNAPLCLYPLAVGSGGIWDIVAYGQNGRFLNGGN